MRRILMMFFCGIAVVASATDYYVSSSGDDSADGRSSSSPWMSIEKVNSEFYQFNPGDRILFRRGDVFYGTINVSRAGISGNPITISSYGTGDLPVISGFSTITDWNDEGYGIYSASVYCESTPNLLTIDGVNKPIGRWPNAGWNTIESHYGSTSISDSELSSCPNWEGAEVVVRPEAWVINRKTITDHSGQTITFSSLNYEPHDGDGYFIQSHFSTLDSFGEWYYDGSKLYVFFGPGSYPGNYNVKISTKDRLVNMIMKSNITVDYLEFQGANVSSIYFEESDNVIIQNSRIRFAGQTGIREGWGSENTIITNNIISHCNNGGIYLSHSTSNASITDNTVEYSGCITGMGANSDDSYSGIVCMGNYSQIRYNDVLNSGYIGIRCGGQSSEISNNFINYSCLCKDDGGGIYSYNDENTDKLISHNIVLNSQSQPDGFNNYETNRSHGIYIDGSDNFHLSDNVVAGNEGYGLFINEARNITTDNNTCYNNIYGMYITSGDTYARYQNHENNIYFARTTAQYSFAVITTDGLEEIPNFGSSNYNYFIRPISDDNYIVVWYYAWGSSREEYNLSEWEDISGGKDSGSNTTPVTIDDVSKIRFEYNATNSDQVVSLDGDYIDAKGTKYSGNITLSPYSAAVLMVDPDPSAPPDTPVYSGSAIENATPSRLEMTYSLSLANIVPPASAFAVRVNSNARNVSSVAVSGTKVLLTLDSPVAYGDAVTVEYTRPSTNPLQTAAGGVAESISAQNVTNRVAAPEVPVYVSSAIENATPSRLEITYSLNLANIVPPASAFAVRVNSNARNVSSVAISGTKVLLALTSPVAYGDVITVTYTRPSTNPLQTTAGGVAASISSKSVTNRVAAPVAPVYVSSAIENATPSRLEMTYNLSLANIVPPTSAFIVKVNSNTRNVSSVAISGTKVLLTLGSPVAYGDAITVAYARPSTNPLQTTAGGVAASLSARSVTNNVAAPTVPVYKSSAIENATPSKLEMTYSLSLANIIPSASAFTVKVNSSARTVSSVAISGTKVLLTLSSPVIYGDIVTVAYTRPSTDPLQTTAGGVAASLSARSVTNNVAAPTVPVYKSSAIENATPSRLEMTYSLSLANIIPSASAFTVKVNSSARTVSSVVISGTKVLLTLSSPVVYGDIVTIAYTRPSANPLQTTAGGMAASLSTRTVTNKVSVINTPPVVVVTSPSISYSGFIDEISAGESYDANEDNLSYNWSTSPGVPLSSTTEPTIKFLGPIVNEPTTIEFTVKVSDGKTSQSKIISVDILPYKPELELAEIFSVEASSYHNQNYPHNIIDGNIGTMWSAEGDNQWLIVELKEPFSIQHINMAFQPGQKAESYFDILVSDDMENWEPILLKSASCDFSGDLQIFDFPPSKTGKEFKYIKLVGRCNSVDTWNHISELKVFGYRHRNPSFYENLAVKIYPNPAIDHITIRIDEPTLMFDFIRIIHFSGHVLFQDKVDEGVREFDIPVNFLNGIYLIQMGKAGLTLFSNKLIVNK